MKRFLLPVFLLLYAITIETAEIQETLVVDLVDLYFTATDQKGHFITDLKQDEITVMEDGVSQKIQRFGAFAGERNEIPLILALVVDNSASMDSKVEQVRKLDLARDAGLTLLEELGPLDRVKLVQFSDILKSTELTSSKETIRDELKKMQPRWWQTAMFDAVATTITDLNGHSGRKILLLSSDGQDNMSKTKLEEVVEMASRTPDLTVIVLGTVANAPVVGMRGKVKNLPAIPMFRGREILQSLAEKTAGYAFFPKNLKESEKVSELLRSFVRSQYYLAYRSTNQKLDGSFRKIKIQCKRKGIHLRYRTGYYAS
ncbi:VWA domain-containing protein [bacterium]|nr:VWA domain-containing protein [bacterium]